MLPLFHAVLKFCSTKKLLNLANQIVFKAYVEHECSKLFVLQQTKCVSTSETLKQCYFHIVLVQLYVETADDFNVLFVKSFLALSLLF